MEVKVVKVLGSVSVVDVDGRLYVAARRQGRYEVTDAGTGAAAPGAPVDRRVVAAVRARLAECARFDALDRKYGTDPRSPLHHNNRHNHKES